MKENECHTDASNDLNSASLACLYSSISLLASERASLNLWRRSGEIVSDIQVDWVDYYDTDIDVPAGQSLRLLSLLQGVFVFLENVGLPMIFCEPRSSFVLLFTVP